MVSLSSRWRTVINVEIVKIMHIKSITVYCFILREYELLTWWEGRRDGAGIEREEGKGGIPPYSLNLIIQPTEGNPKMQ